MASSVRFNKRQQRLGRRLVRHHLPLVLLSCALVWVIARLPTDGTQTFRLSIATAYAALILLSATLLLGPLNVLRARPNPVSTDLRRDIGIWAGIVGLAHVWFGFGVHLGGKILYYFTYTSQERKAGGLRTDVFGWANYSGLVATLLLALLLALSNDLTLRGLGTGIWKTLQRLNYGLLVLVALHGVLYQRVEKRYGVYLFILSILIALVVLIQLAGAVRRLQSKSSS